MKQMNRISHTFQNDLHSLRKVVAANYYNKVMIQCFDFHSYCVGISVDYVGLTCYRTFKHQIFQHMYICNFKQSIGCLRNLWKTTIIHHYNSLH